MKNKKPLLIGLSALAISALAVPITIKALQRNKPQFTTTDPITYDDKSETTIEYEKMELLPNRAAEYSLPNKVNLVYINDDGRCKARRFYTWVDELDGVEQTSDEDSANSLSLSLDFVNDPRFQQYGGKESLWLIMKFGGTWAGQSEDTKIVYADYLEFYQETGELNLWIIPAEGSALEICTSYEDTQITKVSTAKFTDWKTIHCVSSDPNAAPLWVKLYCFDRVYLTSDASSQVANKDIYLLKELNNITTSEFDITLQHTAHINVQYVVESQYPGFTEKPARKCFVSFENLYSTPRFSEHYLYNGDDLGVTYTPERTTFKVWSPISATVDIRLYLEGTPASAGGSDAGRTSHMFYTGNGVWEITVEGDLLQKDQRFYNYIVTNPAGNKMEVVDPYAHAVGYNGLRGYVYDPKSAEANPSDWNSVPAIWDGKTGYDIKNPQDLSVYEVHVRDLTMDSTWTGTSKRGTYDAFCEKGTSYSEEIGGVNYTVSTGFDHIEELGVKAVQLLPVFDSDNEESYAKYKFNWGYNPLNYNCVEGAYSSDPTDPMARIVEYKNLIKEYANNANHTRIIMDVVYNHVSSAPNSCFTKLMPKYYFRYTSNWSYTNGSGCANDVRTEAPMMRKYIVDSLKWWATEYKIKGFRFDLMGLIDVETMRQVRNALTAIDPDIYIYGEGWTSGGTNFDAGAIGSDTANVYSQLYKSSSTNGYVGAFNDEARNAIRGNNDSGWAEFGNKYPTWGFVSDGKGDGSGLIPTLYDMVKGYHTGKGGNPNQMIAYASCHDNYTVWDQLRYGLAQNGYSSSDEMGSGRHYEKPLRPHSGGEPAISDLVAGSIMAHGIVMASNGVAFMQGGEEIYRTKTISDVDNPAQGFKATPEYDDLVAGGDEAIVRPFPSYMGYDPKNNPEDSQYDPNAPISILCTGEVKMYGTHEMVSHNSYKLPDSVNSFKWDRKIHIGSQLTYDKFDAWKSMISLRHSTAKYDYDELFTGGYDARFSIWGDGSFSTSGGVGFYIPNGIHVILSSRDGGSLSIGNGQNFIYYSKNYASYQGGTLGMSAYSIFVYKL